MRNGKTNDFLKQEILADIQFYDLQLAVRQILTQEYNITASSWDMFSEH